MAAEDTRVSARLLRHYGVEAPVFALHAHNERRAAQKIVGLLAQGRSVALVCDAGTPGISDPGAVAVRAVRDAGYAVVPLPGPNAAVCALSAAGNAETTFLFCGFPAAPAATRRRELAALAGLPYLLVFYEAPHRVSASVEDMAGAFGSERTITIARELTKRFETLHTCSLGAAGAWFAADPNHSRGEFVLLVQGAPAAKRGAEGSAPRVLDVLLRELPLAQAVKLAAEITGARKNEVYAQALQLRGSGDD